MALDARSTLLVIVDLVALLVLTRYLAVGYMAVLFGLLLLIVWFWLYKAFVSWNFRRSVSIAFLAGLGLYVPSLQVRIVCLAFVAPALASASMTVIRAKGQD